VSGVLVELCAGTAAVSLRALAGRPVQPLVGYMGGKRRWASQLAELLGFGDRVPDRVVLVDAGPWGDVWEVLRDRLNRRLVINLLTEWSTYEPEKLWRALVAEPPHVDGPNRVAGYLAIQNGAPSSVPLWWDGTRWTQEGRNWSKDRRKIYGVETRAACFSALRIGDLSKAADRVAALDLVDWGRIEVRRCLVEDVEPVPGAAVYFDPPYLNCTRYAVTLSRYAVLKVAAQHAAAGCRVLVSEGEPLPLTGWGHARLAEREWLTASWPISVAEQLNLLGAA
jgi:hypothetical protein